MGMERWRALDKEIVEASVEWIRSEEAWRAAGQEFKGAPADEMTAACERWERAVAAWREARGGV